MRPGLRAQACGIALLLALAPPASAQETACTPEVGTFASVEGEVFYARAGSFDWQPAALDQPLCTADSVRVGARSRAAVRLINEAVLRLDQNTTLQLSDVQAEPEERSFLQLIAGVVQSFVRRPRLLAINTPYLNAAIEGTEFVVAAADGQSQVTVFEGVVRATNDQGEVVLAGGEQAVAEAGRAPVKQIVVRPRDAVQWAIYYPPVLAAGPIPADLPAALRTALERYGAGDIAGAFRALDEVPPAARDARYHLYTAELLLAVGQVGEAEAAIGRARAAAPDSAEALALESVIRVAQDDREAALSLAQRAVELAPAQAAPLIALSYAQQARFDLEAAHASLERAVAAEPLAALAWARLAELRQMLGQRVAARQAAERSASLAPGLGRPHTVLGFARLVVFDTTGARAAFARAIALGSADPLPHLGQGLARIRDGELTDGRADIEIAAGLDPNNALIRAYLGKAYFEEKRDDIANQQFGIAQELDPLDPTAYLYEAIKQQTENRPVEALESLERSIELNDNRAVYRSRLLLDSDRAARGASLATIYDDLGFNEVAVQEAARSVALDPTQAAAHRFLSDALIGIRRTEVARVSELLQAQMLQDVNINPVQPSQSEANLNIISNGGPAEAGFNEFTPLFESNQVQADVTAFAGNNSTYGGETVVSALHGPVSASAGVFHYRTDGWRDNNDVQQDLGNFFLQAALTPEVNAQVELRTRSTDTGDLAFNFDPDDFNPNEKRSLDQNSARLGLRYSPTVSNDILLSAIYTDSDEKLSDQFDTDFGPATSDARVDEHGYRLEGQHIYRHEIFNTVAGMAYADADAQVEASLIVAGEPFIDFNEPDDTTYVHPYIYGNLNLPAPVTWTLGVSYDDFEQGDLSVEEVSPKFGVEWSITDALRLRGAAVKVVKPPLATNQTLEPTRVGGFNQLFDDANGDRSTLYGVGLDWQPADNLFFGAEATWRELKVSFFDDVAGETDFADQHEQTYGGYAFWAPLPEWALTLEVVYDRFKSERSLPTLTDEIPEQVETLSIPLNVRYFHPSGFFAGARGTFVDQQVAATPGNFLDIAEGSDQFFVVDLTAGYRLPKRFGVVSVSVSNLFDTGFHYQDDSFREFSDSPSIGPYIPDRQFVGRITLNW